MKTLIMTAITGLSLFTSAFAFGQQIPTCIDRNTGRQVPVITNAGQQNPAFSTLDQRTGAPVIFINAPLLQSLGLDSSPYTLIFIVEHECGHVNLGHLTTGPVSRKKTNQEELAADCYAAQAVRQMGFTPAALQAVLADVIKLPKDPDHPAGTVRAKNAAACFSR